MPRVILCLLVLSAGLGVWGRDAVGEGVVPGDPQCLERLLYVDQLHDLAIHDLRLLRNTIYARHGLAFQSQDLKTYFSRFAWYAAEQAAVKDRLTSIDIANARLIARIEKNAAPRSAQGRKLVGVWHPDPVMPATPPDQLTFFANGTFGYIFQAGTEIFGSKGFSGLWRIQGKQLSLVALTETIFTYDAVALSEFGNRYEGPREGRKYVIPERTEINPGFDIGNEEIVPGKLKRDRIVLFGVPWYKHG